MVINRARNGVIHFSAMAKGKERAGQAVYIPVSYVGKVMGKRKLLYK